MITDLGPLSKVQLRSIPIADPGLASRALTVSLQNYILSCQVEGKSPNTIEGYHRRLRQFLGFASEYDVADPSTISSTHVRLYLLSLQARKLNPSTVNVSYRVLNTFFYWLVAEGLIDKSPMGNIKPPRIPRTTPKPFTVEDIHKLSLLASGNRFVDVRNLAMVLLFLDTGLRLSEMAKIQLQDLDFDHEIIQVMGKGTKKRVVRMGKRTQKALLKYLLRREDHHDCLWLNNCRQPITRDGVQCAMKKLARRAGIEGPRLGPHTFRHTFATMAIRNGANVFYVQSLLGHSTLTMTRRYASTVDSEEAVKAHGQFSPVDYLKA